MKTDIKSLAIILSLFAAAFAGLAFANDINAADVEPEDIKIVIDDKDQPWYTGIEIDIAGQKAYIDSNIGIDQSKLTDLDNGKKFEKGDLDTSTVRTSIFNKELGGELTFNIVGTSIDFPIEVNKETKTEALDGYKIENGNLSFVGTYTVYYCITLDLSVTYGESFTTIYNVNVPLIILKTDIIDLLFIEPKEVEYDWGNDVETTVYSLDQYVQSLLDEGYFNITGNIAQDCGDYLVTVEKRSLDTKVNYVMSSDWTDTWTVTKKDITGEYGIDSGLVYNGTYQRPSITYVTIEGHDIGLSGTFTKHKNAGQYSDDFTPKDSNNLSGTITINWSIAKKDITSDYIILDPETLDYTGEEQGPTVTLTTNDLVKNETIPAKYYMKAGDKGTKAETYTVVVTIKDNCVNFTGEAEKDWSIVKPPIDLANYILLVNEINLTGSITKEVFRDNLFLYPTNYLDPLNDGEDLVLSDEIFDDLVISVRDGWGNYILKDNVTCGTGTTLSDSNFIIVKGEGNITGVLSAWFDIELSTKGLEVGSQIVEDGIQYTVTSVDKKTVSVSGYTGNFATDLVLPDFVAYGEYKVTQIAEKAFYGCKTLTSVTLGNYITSIGVKAFTNCTKLQSVEFEDSLKTISAYAFYGCTKLADVSMDDSVKTIGSYAFYKCTALKTINISGALKTLGGNAFSVSFIDADGKGITQTAKNLAGHTFEGSNKILKLVA